MIHTASGAGLSVVLDNRGVLQRLYLFIFRVRFWEMCQVRKVVCIDGPSVFDFVRKRWNLGSHAGVAACFEKSFERSLRSKLPRDTSGWIHNLATLLETAKEKGTVFAVAIPDCDSAWAARGGMSGWVLGCRATQHEKNDHKAQARTSNVLPLKFPVSAMVWIS